MTNTVFLFKIKFDSYKWTLDEVILFSYFNNVSISHLNKWSAYPPEGDPVLARMSVAPPDTTVSTLVLSRVDRSVDSLFNMSSTSRVVITQSTS